MGGEKQGIDINWWRPRQNIMPGNTCRCQRLEKSQVRHCTTTSTEIEVTRHKLLTLLPFQHLGVQIPRGHGHLFHSYLSRERRQTTADRQRAPWTQCPKALDVHRSPLKKKPQESGCVELACQAGEDASKGFHARKLFESRGGEEQLRPPSTGRILLGRETHLRLQMHISYGWTTIPRLA